MPRLFITPKEVSLINDWTKEYVKDIVGQEIFYYPISIIKSKPHSIYDEAIRKFFDHPIRMPILAGVPERETRHNNFGLEHTTKLELFIQARDLIDKGLSLAEGDYFTYGESVYEITSYLATGNIFGLVEYVTSYKVEARLARPNEFDPKTYLKARTDQNLPFTEKAVQQEFSQQRGLPENSEGETGDVRETRQRLGDDLVDVALGQNQRTIEITTDKKTSSTNIEPQPKKKNFYGE